MRDFSARARYGMKTACTVLVLLGLVVAGMTPVAAAPPNSDKDRLGNDVSWPQCGKDLPTAQAFAIIGVTGGLANNTNPCLGDQLAWAATATGRSSQPKVALYVNTANPGHEGSWWPSSNNYKNVNVPNPYGECRAPDGEPEGPVNLPCSYMYGYAKAYDDALERGVSNPGTYFWWLDVETGNSWQTGADNSTALNRATLEGMVNYFKNTTVGVGIYSTSYQWGIIAGTVPSGSSLAGLPSWLAGAKTLRGAKSNCSLPGLTPGSPVTVTQYVSAGLDYDYSCK